MSKSRAGRHPKGSHKEGKRDQRLECRIPTPHMRMLDEMLEAFHDEGFSTKSKTDLVMKGIEMVGNSMGYVLRDYYAEPE